MTDTKEPTVTGDKTVAEIISEMQKEWTEG